MYTDEVPKMCHLSEIIREINVNKNRTFCIKKTTHIEKAKLTIH